MTNPNPKLKCQGRYRRHRWQLDGFCKRCGDRRNPKAKPLGSPREEEDSGKETAGVVS